MHSVSYVHTCMYMYVLYIDNMYLVIGGTPSSPRRAPGEDQKEDERGRAIQAEDPPGTSLTWQFCSVRRHLGPWAEKGKDLGRSDPAEIGGHPAAKATDSKVLRSRIAAACTLPKVL